MPQRINLPAVSAAEMRQIDELAESSYHIQLIQMMENAGRSLARCVRDRFLAGSAAGASLLVLAGPGGNGGGGLVATRRLHGWGAEVCVMLATSPDRLAPVSGHQLAALEPLAIPRLAATDPWPKVDAILDSLLGYSAVGAPRSPMDRMITAANGSGAPIVALDLPTGLDPNDGTAAEPTIRAAATVTLALPKTGLMTDAAAPFVGDLWLADIGLPKELYADLGLDVPFDLFAKDDLIQLLPHRPTPMD
ncbi:MAG: NAD(P)H-hydrate epimerase [Anaerolineales bacterium]